MMETPSLSTLQTYSIICEKNCHVPDILKTGLLTPVLKKDKDKRLPGNYRGIAVTPIISKVLESIIMRHSEPKLKHAQNALQRGFTEETAPLNAGIIATEAICEAKDNGVAMGFITLDAEKAFDVLGHEHLMCKLYHDGLMDDLWNFMRILQTKSITKIKWRGKLGDIFFNKQGIRQGAKLSPSLYKQYNHQLLNTLTTHNAGTKIGTTFIGAPTVADDIALIAFNPTDLQCALNIVANETAKDKVTINSSKSAVIIYNANKQREKQEWKLGENKIEEVDSTTHIGNFRELRGKNDNEIYDVGDTMHIGTTGYSQNGFKTPLLLYVFAKGKQIQSYALSSGDITDILIDQTMSLAPSASLLLYSVSTENELIADEMAIFVSGLVKNQMTMAFSTERQQVGRDVTLQVTSDPNSHIFLVAIDKGSQLLKKPNDITSDQAKKAVMEYNIRDEKKKDNHWNPWFMRGKRSVPRELYYDGTAAKNILETVGVVYLTDATVAEVEDQGTFIMEANAEDWFKANNNQNVNSNSDKIESGSENEIRKNFPETWIWLNDVSSNCTLAKEHDILYSTDVFAAMVRNDMDGMAADINSGQNKQESISTDSSTSQIRKNFPETWIWLNEMVGSDGSYSTTLKLPDTITSWTTRGFSISPTRGLGIARNVQVEAFKQFFVVVSLPPTVYRGEKMEVKLVVFNYFQQRKSVSVTLKHSQDFMIYSDLPTDTSQPLSGDFRKTFQVEAGLSKGTSLYISPTKVGNIMLQVEAKSGSSLLDSSDIVQKVIPVDPEGKTEYKSVQQLIDASATQQIMTVVPDFPPNFVPDSRKVTIAVTGDIMGQSLQNLDGMIQVPYGCGEQNIASLVPNIYALSYMKAAGIADPDIEAKAKKYMKQGYQRELKYKHDNGGYSAFGKQDKSFSTWLTAFVMKSFSQAKRFTFISNDVLLKAKEAIMSQSNQDGSFNEPGYVIHKNMMSGTGSGSMLTAYIYIALIETINSGDSIPDTFNSSRTLTYLENFYKSTKHVKTPFQLAVLSYCFSLGNSKELQNVLSDLSGSSTRTDNNDMQCWCNMEPKMVGNKKTYMSYNVKPSAIETASYVLLAYIQQNDLTSGIPIMKWLMTQINGKGGFMSTQDTVMGLQALSRYAELLSSADHDATVTFKTVGHANVMFTIDKDTSILLQKQELPNIAQIAANGVEIIVQGKGNAVVSVNWEYNLDVNDGIPDLQVTVQTYKKDYYTIEIDICVWYEGSDDPGMGMTYVDIPTGYFVSNMAELNKDARIQRVELEGRTLNMYFNSISRKKICIAVYARWEYIVVDIKPCPVRVQFYYEPEKQKTTYYSVSSQIKPTDGASGMTSSMFFLTFVMVVYALFC